MPSTRISPPRRRGSKDSSDPPQFIGKLTVGGDASPPMVPESHLLNDPTLAQAVQAVADALERLGFVAVLFLLFKDMGGCKGRE